MIANFTGQITGAEIIDDLAANGHLEILDQWGNVAGITTSLITSGRGYIIRFSNVSFNGRTKGNATIREQIDDETHFTVFPANGFIDFTCYAGAQLRANCSFTFEIEY